MEEGLDIVTIVFLCLAVFVIWRLRSVLGQRTGNERPPYGPFTRRDQQRNGAGEAAEKRDGDTGNVVRLPGPAANDAGEPAAVETPAGDRWKGIVPADSSAAAGLDAIAAAESGFDARMFSEGAKAAYEMIVVAFARGDRKTLKGLLARDVYEGFDRAISDRERKGEIVNTTFVSIENSDITGVEVQGTNAQITVRFTSQLITATLDAGGTVIDGSPEEIVDVVDTWTFARTLRSSDPNWLLVATEAGQ